MVRLGCWSVSLGLARVRPLLSSGGLGVEEAGIVVTTVEGLVMLVALVEVVMCLRSLVVGVVVRVRCRRERGGGGGGGGRGRDSCFGPELE